MTRRDLGCPILFVAALAACVQAQPPRPAVGSGDAAFAALARDILEDHYLHHPSHATDLGIHRYDDQLEDLSQAAIKSESDTLKVFRSRLAAIDPATLTLTSSLDREQLMHTVDERTLELDTIRMWAKDPDTYSSGVTNAAYVIMKHGYAPAETRLKALVAREKKMPAALQEAHVNIEQAVTIYTQIAIEQIDGDISFFRKDVPAAFAEVTDKALRSEFQEANDGVVAELGTYKTFLQKELLPKAKGRFAYGAETYAKALAAQEAVALPLERLLQIAEADRQKNEDAFQVAAKRADNPTYRLAQVRDALLRDVRFIVGIKMHTQGLTVDEATTLFETQGHQPHPVAVSEAKRGTADALYGYYTIGKLMILKLRDDYKTKMGTEYSLRKFHDAFIELGPLPMPLVRRAMLGEVGSVL